MTRGGAGPAPCTAAIRPGRDGGNSRERNGDTIIDRELLAELEREEPLSLAEELDKAAERVRRIGAAIAHDDAHDRNIHIAELQRMTMPELIATAEQEKLTEITGLKKQELIFRILKERVKLKGLMYGEGTLEILPDGFGFLRSPDYHYLSCPDDIYVSPSQIRRFGLRNGNTVAGTIRPPKENERYFALLRVEGDQRRRPEPARQEDLLRRSDARAPGQADRHGDDRRRNRDARRRHDRADRLRPARPDRQPAAGRQDHPLQKMAKAVLTNYPDAYVIMLLIDERPEEVTDMERQIKGPNCEVISSTFDETSARHVQVSEMVIEKAKRMVEYGRDVLIFLDSITRLARAWNAECPHSGKILSGGIDANAMQRPKRFFGSARKVEDGGSLTIIATALVDTGSRMDEVIFEEFKGTGNQEIVLDRRLVDRRIWPAIDISRSGTRKEEMLMDPEEHRRVCLLRRVLNDMNPPDAMELLVTPAAKDQDQRRVPDEREGVEPTSRVVRDLGCTVDSQRRCRIATESTDPARCNPQFHAPRLPHRRTVARRPLRRSSSSRWNESITRKLLDGAVGHAPRARRRRRGDRRRLGARRVGDSARRPAAGRLGPLPRRDLSRRGDPRRDHARPAHQPRREHRDQRDRARRRTFPCCSAY